MKGPRGRHAVLFCKGCPALRSGSVAGVPLITHCLSSTVQEVERQHEALQEAGNVHSQREGQLRGVQAEVSRLQVRWISDVVFLGCLEHYLDFYC